MTLVSDIIFSAYRELNLVAANATLTPAQTSEGLDRLRTIVPSVYGNEASERLQPFPLGRNNINAPEGFPWWELPPGDWFLPLNQRLMLNLQAPLVFDLNPIPEDGSRFAIMDESNNLATNTVTVRGNGRLIEGAPTLLIDENGFSAEWFYRADMGDWLRVSPLDETDTFPFPAEFEDMFVIMLALRLAPRHGRSISPESSTAAERSRSQFRARYRQKIDAYGQPGLQRLSVQTYPNNTRLWGPQPSGGDVGRAYLRNGGFPW